MRAECEVSMGRGAGRTIAHFDKTELKKHFRFAAGQSLAKRAIDRPIGATWEDLAHGLCVARWAQLAVGDRRGYL